MLKLIKNRQVHFNVLKMIKTNAKDKKSGMDFDEYYKIQ